MTVPSVTVPSISVSVPAVSVSVPSVSVSVPAVSVSVPSVSVSVPSVSVSIPAVSIPSVLPSVTVALPTSVSVTLPSATCSQVLKNPSPSFLYCGTQGTLTAPAVLGTKMNVGSAAICADVCYQNNLQVGSTLCRSISYNPSSQVCMLYTKSPLEMGYTDTTSNTGVFKYNLNCYQQQCGVATGAAKRWWKGDR